MRFFKPNVRKMLERRNSRGLIRALYDQDSKIRKEAIEALIKIGSLAVEPLNDELNDRKNDDVQYTIVTILGRIGDARSVDPLVATLKDAKSFSPVKRNIVHALGQIKDQRSVDALLELMTHKRFEMWVDVALILGSKKEARAIESLIAMLEDKDHAWSDRRVAAAQALGQIGDSRAVKPLLDAIDSDHILVGLACFSAITQLPGDHKSKVDVNRLIESTAKEIQLLYSQTTSVVVGHTEPEFWHMGHNIDEWVSNPIYEDRADPDMEGIHKLVALLPKSLHNQVRSLSGDAGALF